MTQFLDNIPGTATRAVSFIEKIEYAGVGFADGVEQHFGLGFDAFYCRNHQDDHIQYL